MKVGTRLRVTAVLPVILALAISVILFHVSSRVNAVVQQHTHIGKIVDAVFKLHAATRDYERNPGPGQRAEWLRHHDVLQTAIGGIKGTIGEDDFNAIDESSRSIRTQFTQFPEPPAVPPEEPMRKLWADSQVIVSKAIVLSRNAGDQATALQYTAYMLIVGVSAVLAALLALLSMLASRSVAHGVETLTEGTRKLAGGDLAHTIAVTSSDELGQLAVAFNDMIGKVAEATGTLRDEIAERTRIADELRQSNRNLSDALVRIKRAQGELLNQERYQALRQVSRGIVHDMNDALMPILGLTELYMRYPQQLDNAGGAPEAIKAIHEAAGRAREVVKHLSEFFSPVSSNQIDTVDIAKTAEEAVGATEPMWHDQKEAQGIQITIETELGAVAPLRGNTTDIRMAIDNFILNAADAIKKSGTITVTTRQEGDHAVIEVTDTGEGMPANIKERCTEPFFSTRGHGHSGMGLTAARGVAQRHGGSIEIQTDEGKGTTVRMRIPISAPKPPARPQVRGADSDRKLSVLAVDDEPWVTTILQRHLDIGGHKAVAVENAAAGLEQFQAWAFDLVILDRAMPDMSGDELARRIHAIDSKVPIIMLTGFGDIMTESGEQPEAVDLILSKPVSFEGLSLAILQITGVDISGV